MAELDHQSRSSGTPSSESQPAEPEELSRDDIFHLLQTQRRRESLRYLVDHEDETPLRMRNISEYVAAKEHNTTVKQLTSAQRQRVYIPLYQSHLPKLDKKDIIDYNQSRGIVRPGNRLEEIRPYLEPGDLHGESEQSALASASSGDARLGYYLTALGTSLGLLGATGGGLLTIPGLLLATIITVLFTLAGAATTLADALSSSESETEQTNFLRRMTNK